MGSTEDDPIVISNNDFDTDSEMPMPGSVTELVLRGPKIKGNLFFDDYCYYGNNMVLTEDQMSILTYWCGEGEADAKYYLYKMTNSSVIEKKCKLAVGAEFTRTHLECFLANPVNVLVDCSSSSKKFNVKMRMAKFSNNAIICGGWDAAVKTYNITEDEIVLFDFWLRNDGGMLLTLVKLGKSHGDE